MNTIEELAFLKDFSASLLPCYHMAVDNLFEQKSEHSIANWGSVSTDIIDEMIFKYTPSKGKICVLCKNPEDYLQNERILAEIQRASRRDVEIAFNFTQGSQATTLLKHVSFEKVEPIYFERNKQLYFITNGDAVRIERSPQESEAIPNAPTIAKKLIEMLEERKHSLRKN